MARHRRKLIEAADWLREMNIGGTAVGTGINAEAEYPGLMVEYLSEVSGLELREGKDRVQLMQSMGDIASFSGAFRAYVLDLNKIANDIRLLASGRAPGSPRSCCRRCSRVRDHAGQGEPLDREMVNQVCFQAIGLDTTVAMAAEAASSSST